MTLLKREEYLTTFSFLYLTNTLILWLLINFIVEKFFQLGALKVFKAGIKLIKPSLVNILEINTTKSREKE
jgi:hypothetical protein